MTDEIKIMLRGLSGILKATLGDMPNRDADKIVSEVADILEEISR